MYWYTPVSDGGLVYGDELDEYARVVAMKYAAAINDAGAGRLVEWVRIDDGVDPEFIILNVASPLIIYVKQHAGDANGTYLFDPVPF